MKFVNRLGGKAELGYNVLLLGVNIEGIVLGGNIETIARLKVAIVIFNVKAVCLQRLSVNVIIFAPVMAL